MLESSLQAASLRHQATAHNIANVNTPGFKRARVEFEQHLAEAIRRGQDPTSIRATVVRTVDTQGRPDGNNVDVEAEMTLMAENQIWHAALTRQVSDHFARLRMVIHDGRR